jgi:hypothetical protein
MISLLTAFFLYGADASWYWWVAFAIIAAWQFVVAIYAMAAVIKK